MPFGQVVSKWVETISNLKRHIYRKREQVASYNKQKDELKTGEAFIHVDYSESCNETQQDEIHSAYFDQQNFIDIYLRIDKAYIILLKLFTNLLILHYSPYLLISNKT